MPIDFKTWLERRQKLAEDNDPSDRFRFNKDTDIAGDYEHELRELTKILTNRYHQEFTHFLEKIANDHQDQEVRSILRNMQNGASPESWKPRHPQEPEEVVPPTADRGANNLAPQ